MTIDPITNRDVLKLITAEQAIYYHIFPYACIDNKLTLFCEKDRKGIAALKQEIEVVTGFQVEFKDTTIETIENLIEKHYSKGRVDSREKTDFYKGDVEGFFQRIVSEAKKLRSSDIHIETYEEKCRVRLRVDGLLLQRYRLDKLFYPKLINKIKIEANLDIAEKRLPQDGRIIFEVDNNKFDIRVSTIPTLFGEKIVLRLLNNDAANIELPTLGFSNFDLDNFLECLKLPHGLILISGPTGSGKTTTLYATLKILNNHTKNILTIEDPIEYTLEGINQVQLKENIGLNFSAALRTFLRQDPDIIMLGEIRDNETAQMGVRAALTGHLVLSTIHTNSAWGIISRLIDMGVEPYLLASTLNAVIAQRLVRLLCPKCKNQKPFENALLPKSFTYKRLPSYHFEAVGCEECHNTGYKGRVAIYEVIPIDNELVESIKKCQQDVSDILQRKGIKKISLNAFEIFESGLTSAEEIYPLLLN